MQAATDMLRVTYEADNDWYEVSVGRWLVCGVEGLHRPAELARIGEAIRAAEIAHQLGPVFDETGSLVALSPVSVGRWALWRPLVVMPPGTLGRERASCWHIVDARR